MIPGGTSLSYQITGQASVFSTFFNDAAGVRSDVISALSAYFNVQNVTVDAESALEQYENLELTAWQYSATVTLVTRSDYGSVDDIGSVVAHAFFDATGYLPTVTNPDYGEPAQQAPTTGGGTGISDAATSLFDGLKSIFTNITNGALSELNMTALLLIVGILALVFVLANGKHNIIPKVV